MLKFSVSVKWLVVVIDMFIVVVNLLMCMVVVWNGFVSMYFVMCWCVGVSVVRVVLMCLEIVVLVVNVFFDMFVCLLVDFVMFLGCENFV